jgi:hypothetical protein
LGKGRVLTAAHVIESVARSKPSVRIAGLDLPAKGNFANGEQRQIHVLVNRLIAGSNGIDRI